MLLQHWSRKTNILLPSGRQVVLRTYQNKVAGHLAEDAYYSEAWQGPVTKSLAPFLSERIDSFLRERCQVSTFFASSVMSGR